MKTKIKILFPNIRDRFSPTLSTKCPNTYRVHSLQIDGTDGAVISRNKELVWFDKDGNQTKEEIQGIEFHSSMTASWTELLNAIDEERMPCHSGKDNLWTVALLEGAYRSASAGKSVEIDVN